jgi:hypothetical protein
MMVPYDHDLDERLQAYARHQAVPDDLAARVYRASVNLLPDRRPLPLRLMTVRRVGAWGRLAMAASIALACAAGLRLLSTGNGAPLSPDAERALLAFASAGPAAQIDPQITAVERLLVTRNMTYRDLEGDVASLAQDLDM